MKALFKCMETKMNRLRGRLNISVNKTPIDFSFQEDEEDSVALLSEPRPSFGFPPRTRSRLP